MGLKLKTKNIFVTEKDIDFDVDVKVKEEKEKRDEKISKAKKNKVQRLVGIDVGSRYIKTIEALTNQDEIIVISAKKIDYPIDLFDEKSAKIMGTAIKDMWSRWERKIKHLCFTSTSEEIGMKEIVVGNETDNDEIQRLLNIDFNGEVIEDEELVKEDKYSVQIIENNPIEIKGEVQKSILGVAYPNEEIDKFLEIVNHMGSKFRPLALDINNNVIRKFWTSLDTINDEEVDHEGAYMFIDIGKNGLNVSAISNRKLRFGKIVEFNQDIIDDEISKSLEITKADAERLKFKVANFEDDSLDETKVVLGIMREYIENALMEVKDLINIFEAKERKNIRKVYIYGGGAKFKGLGKYFEYILNVSTERIEKFESDKILLDLDPEGIEDFINCIGAVIRG